MRFSGMISMAALVSGVLCTEGSFKVLSYNIAGLPPIINSNGIQDKAVNTAEIARRIAGSDFDVVHVQEDFAYNNELYTIDTHPYRTQTSGNVPFGSGLNTLSNYPFYDFHRITWRDCYTDGGDCLTPKGFTFMRLNISSAATMDFYNLHAEASNGPNDQKARKSNIQQLAEYIAIHSVGQPVLVFGDTNTLYSHSFDTTRELLKLPTGLKDAWVELELGGLVPEHAQTCNDASTISTCEALDKVLYRSGSHVVLQAKEFKYETERFARKDGKGGLSDHNPVSAAFSWSLK